MDLKIESFLYNELLKVAARLFFIILLNFDH